MSSAASLVAGITGTNLLSNVERMMRTGVVPFAASLLAYVALGRLGVGAGGVPQDVVVAVTQAFRSFDLSAVVLLPVAVVLVLCLLHVDVRMTIVASLLVSVAICVGVQHRAPAEVARTLVLGFHAADPMLSRLADGGGVVSMAELACIVGVASTYSGLFEGTGLIDVLGSAVTALARRTTPFVGVLATSIATAAIACD
jgi:NhaC family Na+:H+ antiporter